MNNYNSNNYNSNYDSKNYDSKNYDSNLVIKESSSKGIKWFDPLVNMDNVTFYGFNWIAKDKVYCRLPMDKIEEVAKVSEKLVGLANCTSGGQLHFITNSKKLIIHAKTYGGANLSGMAFVGQIGFDCYVGTNYDNLLFFNTARFAIDKNEYEFTLFDKIGLEDNAEHLIVINFPLYGGVKEISLGIEEKTCIKKPIGKRDKIAYYGTSILQGGCASRPGLAYTNIMSRWLKKDFLNFGFSGNAFGENIIAKIMGDIEDVKMYIIDYEANGGTNGKLAETLDSFILTLREKHQTIPIVVVSRIKYLFDDLNKEMGLKREKIRKFQEDTVKKYRRLGDEHIYYINGQKLLGNKYDEYTIDSIHPNDIGFMILAKNLNQRLEKIIIKEKI